VIQAASPGILRNRGQLSCDEAPEPGLADKPARAGLRCNCI